MTSKNSEPKKEAKPTHDERGYKLPTLPTPYPGYSMMKDIRDTVGCISEKRNVVFNRNQSRPKSKLKKR